MKPALSILALAALWQAIPCVASARSVADSDMTLVSPNGKIRITIDAPREGNGAATFDVDYLSSPVIADTRLGFETSRHKFADNMRLASVSGERTVADDYVMHTGKRSHCTNRANERVYTFANDADGRLEVTFRAYDDGVTFRYSIGTDAVADTVTRELTTYRIPDGTRRWFQPYDVSYERFYPLATTGDPVRGDQQDRWAYPALAQTGDSVFMLITESDIRRGHAASMLDNAADRSRYSVRYGSDRQPFSGLWESPWRVLIVGSAADIVESTLVTDVAEAPRNSLADWVSPGPASWIYWAYNHGSKDFVIVKDYIDLAAEMGWPYVLIDWEWDIMENGGNIRDAIDYAHQKGVKILMWYNSCTAWAGEGAPGPLFRLNTPEARRQEYAWLREIGVDGVKIDFFNGDDTATMDYCIDLLDDAIPHHLLVTLHGATAPRGWQRTYPNLMTVEGVYGAEWYNNAPELTDKAAAHNATLPFTRNVVGPMDYTPGTFTDSQHPHITSHGHELALHYLFESPVQHMPDRPSTYRSLPPDVAAILSELPTTWDDTRLLTGYPGENVVMARRKGDVWYVAGINGSDAPATLDFSLARLGVEGKTATIFADGPSQHELAPVSTATVGAAPMAVPCLPRGGFVAIIR